MIVNNDILGIGKVSLDRATSFLQESELLDSFSTPSAGSDRMFTHMPPPDTIGFSDAVFSWSSNVEDGSLTPSRSYKLHVPGKLIFKRHSINLIVGPTYVQSRMCER
jgi:hypothetical protein